MPKEKMINHNSPKSRMVVNVGGMTTELNISFADLFDEVFLKPIKEEYRKKTGKEWDEKK